MTIIHEFNGGMLLNQSGLEKPRHYDLTDEEGNTLFKVPAVLSGMLHVNGALGETICQLAFNAYNAGYDEGLEVGEASLAVKLRQLIKAAEAAE